MKTNFLLGCLCAICMITFTVASVISCSGDDEYYEGGNYTLAKKRMTRGVENNDSGPSVKYEGGTKNVELAWDCMRLNFTFTWKEGWNTDDVHVYYNGCSSNSGYQTFYDDLDIERHVPNMTVMFVEMCGDPQLINDVIRQSIAIHYTQKKAEIDKDGLEKKDKNGNTIYVQGPEEIFSSEISLRISSYRKSM